MSTWVLPLTFEKPPLTLNQRLHWSHRKRVTQQIHDEIIIRCRFHKVPAMDHATFTLYYAPADRRRRDVDNLVPTSKAALDGIVRAGILPDDSPEFVDHRMPVIYPPFAVGAVLAHRVWVEIDESA